MHQQTKRIALCGVLAALGIVLQLLGSWTGLGIYLCPMLVGLLLRPVGKLYGPAYQLLLAAAITLVGLLLAVDLEESLMLIGFFGWYPAARPALERLPKVWSLVVKFALFNAAIIALEALLMLVLVPEPIGPVLVLVGLLAANLLFICYDRLLPRLEQKMERRLAPLLK